ncbi:MAG: hypothetical protein Q4F31_03440 [Eubacteriales bacterium]|nr:hypothetical protein [Eubacteriales bacterium]
MTFGSNRAFWFETTAAGYPYIVKPDGSHSHSFRRKAPAIFNVSQQSVDGWRRSMLFMDEFEIDDPTSFGCSVSSIFCCEYGWDDSLLFSSCQTAEEAIYPFLSNQKVEQCRNNVDAFYSDKNLQASWTPLILHPICLKFNKQMDDFEPIPLSEIGDSFLSLRTLKFYPCHSLKGMANDVTLRDLLYRDRNYDEDDL